MKKEPSIDTSISFHGKAVWAIADLHLSLSVPEKDMALISDTWRDYQRRLQVHWERCVASEDLVLIPGDISWATHLEQAAIDLAWIDRLPGTKILSKGNHDMWWSTRTKVNALKLRSIHMLYKQPIVVGEDYLIVGTRLWDDPELSFYEWIDWQGDRRDSNEELSDARERNMKIFEKELALLERMLEEGMKIDPHQKRRWVVMLHYPPADPRCTANARCTADSLTEEVADSSAALSMDRASTIESPNPRSLPTPPRHSRVQALLARYRIDAICFGHLHSMKPSFPNYAPPYHFVAADHLDFNPKRIF